MTYLKAIGAGIVAALLFGAVWAWAALQLPIWWQMWRQRHEFVGFAGSSVNSGSILLAALIGFVLGFAWVVRRASKTRTDIRRA
jgi:hypothetical protein